MEEKLLEDFFLLKGNYKNTEKIKNFEEKIHKYLEENKSKKLESIKIIIEVAKKENKDDFKELCKTIAPITKRLTEMDIKEWDFYDARIAQIVLIWTKTFEEAHEISKLALATLKKYNDKKTYEIEISIYLNMLTRLIKANFIEIDIETELKRCQHLDSIFEDHFNSAIAICESQKEELKNHKLVVLIREAFFYQKYEDLDKYLKELENTGEKELYNTIKKSIEMYASHGGSAISKNQFNIMCGGNLKKARLKYKISSEAISKLTGYKIPNLSNIENGKRTINARIIHQISKEYGISLEELYYGSESEQINDEALELKKIYTMAKSLGRDWFQTINNMLEEFQRQKLRIKRKSYLLQSSSEDED